MCRELLQCWMIPCRVCSNLDSQVDMLDRFANVRKQVDNTCGHEGATTLQVVVVKCAQQMELAIARLAKWEVDGKRCPCRCFALKAWARKMGTLAHSGAACALSMLIVLNCSHL